MSLGKFEAFFHLVKEMIFTGNKRKDTLSQLRIMQIFRKNFRLFLKERHEEN